MSEQIPSEDINNSGSEETKSTETVNPQSDLNKIKDFIQEIKKFQERKQGKQVLNFQFENTLNCLINKLQNIEFTENYLNSRTGQEDIQTVSDFVEYFEKEYGQLPQTQVKQEIQEELAKLLTLSQRIENLIHEKKLKKQEYQELQLLLPYLCLALQSMLQENPNIILVRQTRIGIQKSFYEYKYPSLLGFVINIFYGIWVFVINRYYNIRLFSSTPFKVVSGLITTLLLTSGVTSLILIISIISKYNNPISKSIRQVETSIKTETKRQSKLDKTALEITNINEGINEINNKIENRKAREVEIITNSKEPKDKITSTKNTPENQPEEAIQQNEGNAQTSINQSVNLSEPVDTTTSNPTAANTIGENISRDLEKQNELQENNNQSENLISELKNIDRELKELDAQKIKQKSKLDALLQKPEAQNIEEQKKEVEKSLERYNNQLTILRVDLLQNTQETNTITQLILVIAAGILGSIVSILIRIEEFQNKSYYDPMIPFFIGAFKPIIGASFAIFIFSLISSEVQVISPIYDNIPNQISDSSPTSTSKDKQEEKDDKQEPINQAKYEEILQKTKIEEKRLYFIFALAFVAGFSERIAKDTIAKVEGTLTNNSQNNQQ